MVRAFVVVDRETNLLHVVRATHPGRRFADLLDCGQEQADQDGDDGDDDEQLDERERRLSSRAKLHVETPSVDE